MTKAEEFVSLMLLGRDLAHLAHWKTESYAAHKTLGEFYDELLELTDGFVEQYQGYYSKRMNVQRSQDSQKADMNQVLESQVEWIERNRYQVCSKEETALQNTIDEIVKLYQSTLYKLTLS